MKELVDRLPKVRPVLGRPDAVRDLKERGSGGVGPKGIRRSTHPGHVQGRSEIDAVTGGTEHLGRVAGDGDPVGDRGGGGKPVAPSVPVLDLPEAGVLEDHRGKIFIGALRHDTAAGLGGDGDERGRHRSLLGTGSRMGCGGHVPEIGRDTAALGLEAEGVAIALVQAAVLTGEGGQDVHLTGLVAQGDPPAGIRIAFRGDPDGGHQPAGDDSPLRVGEVRPVRIGTDRADPRRPVGRTCPEPLDRSVESMGQVGQRARLGEQLDRRPVTVARDQPGADVGTAFTRPVQVREQAGGVAGALQMGDHDVYLEREGRNEGPGDRTNRERIRRIRDLARPGIPDRGPAHPAPGLGGRGGTGAPPKRGTGQLEAGVLAGPVGVSGGLE
ncbi:hypothetical protein ACH4M4_16895 [Streptomyces sp. NPDC017254]|uniref:hypothetical protein n=1 Tax=unclassified Streptomyces TaxID=2593676 RepID=UPI0037907D55